MVATDFGGTDVGEQSPPALRQRAWCSPAQLYI